MANIPLQTIKFPGLDDTYTVPQVDDTLAVEGQAADAKVTGDTLKRKANIDGNYDLMNAGTSDNLTPYSEDSGATQSIPFIAQGTGCGNGESVVDTGSYLQFKKKLGNTVCVNNMFNPANAFSWTQDGITVSFNSTTKKYTISGTATATIDKKIYGSGVDTVKGRKYAFISGFSGGSGSLGSGYELYVYGGNFGTYVGMNKINESTNGGGFAIYLKCQSGVTIPTQTFSIDIPDISLWFGSNDRIPSDLLSHPENWGRYYAGSLDYNAGTLESADGSILTSLPRNCFDGELESGAYNPSTGAKVPDANKVRSKNLIPCIPNETYYFRSATALPAQVFYVVFFDAQGNFVDANTNGYYNATKTIPANAHFMGFWAGSASYPVTDTSRKFTISLYYSGESGYDSDYPYSVLAEVDTGSEVLRSAGAVADEKTPDGTITRRVGYVDMGTLTWTSISLGESVVGFQATPTDKAQTFNFMSSKYAAVEKSRVALLDMEMGTYNTTNAKDIIVVRDDSKSSLTGAQFKTAMSGIYLYYELATPTTEQGTPFAENIPCDDFGSMYWTQTKGIPQGNEIFYPVDYKASIDTLYNRVEGDMSKIVIDTELGAVADRIPAAPDTDGTYTLKATVSSGTKTYSWVEDAE